MSPDSGSYHSWHFPPAHLCNHPLKPIPINHFMFQKRHLKHWIIIRHLSDELRTPQTECTWGTCQSVTTRGCCLRTVWGFLSSKRWRPIWWQRGAHFWTGRLALLFGAKGQLDLLDWRKLHIRKLCLLIFKFAAWGLV